MMRAGVYSSKKTLFLSARFLKLLRGIYFYILPLKLIFSSLLQFIINYSFLLFRCSYNNALFACFGFRFVIRNFTYFVRLCNFVLGVYKTKE